MILQNFTRILRVPALWSWWLPLILLSLAGGIYLLGFDISLFRYLNQKLLRAWPDMFWEILTVTGNALTVILLLGVLIHKHADRFCGAILLSLPLTAVIQGIKHLISRHRPLYSIEEFDVFVIGVPLYHNSFPSGHSATVVFACMVFAFAYPTRTTFILISLLAFFGAISRSAVGAHYPTDILVGATIGWYAALTLPFTIASLKLSKERKTAFSAVLILSVCGMFALLAPSQFTVPGYEIVQLLLGGWALTNVTVYVLYRFRSKTYSSTPK